MSDKCTDPRIGKMLHNYEMGILSEAEESEFELHLYSCEYCLNRLEKFDATARHLKFDPEIRAEIKQLAAGKVTSAEEPSFFRRIAGAVNLRWSAPLKISLVAAAVFLVVIMNLVRIEFGRQEPVQASPNSLIITDSAANVKRLLKIIDHLDVESVVKKQIKVYSLNYSNAEQLAALLSQLPKNTDIPVSELPGPAAAESGEAGDAPVRLYGELTVLPDSRSNSLVIATAPSNFKAIDSILARLDSMLNQVLIEAIIMEVSLTEDTKMGMKVPLQLSFAP